ncbi:hypothetical protein SAMN05444280_1575 [Tangfeifania diversioriginum]|uniref:NVEALA protein n=1 Tax=Tangfeifania diversioriginum TaxID=1168035 RepID=A0A1M6PCP0_9BACT|nr:hypothetical protein [Tangfeifania diversioriginum]SHK05708.1 hypothetical protein SAMN05444280_1575 [Tangfeifania diversioriginum]
MNKKVKTITTWLAAAIFLLALAINIKVTLDDPFVMLSDEAIAQTASTTTTTTGTMANACCPIWDVTIETGGGNPWPKVTCTTGGEYKCNDCDCPDSTSN